MNEKDKIIQQAKEKINELKETIIIKNDVLDSLMNQLVFLNNEADNNDNF